MDRDRFNQQKNFILEIDKDKNVLRQTHLTNQGRRENDAEHEWHMAVMAYLLKEYSNEPIDIAHTMIMCLIHDIVEIDAGDTYAYDEEGKKTQKEREKKAEKRIFSILPDDQKQEMMNLFDEFEANETPEAKFAHAMDNFQPLLLNDANDGGDWRQHQVTYEAVMNRQKGTEAGSKELFEYTCSILDEHHKKGDLK